MGFVNGIDRCISINEPEKEIKRLAKKLKRKLPNEVLNKAYYEPSNVTREIIKLRNEYNELSDGIATAQRMINIHTTRYHQLTQAEESAEVIAEIASIAPTLEYYRYDKEGLLLKRDRLGSEAFKLFVNNLP